MTEKELLPEQKVRKVLESALTDYFDLEPEKRFDNSNLRIDYIATCKKTGVVFGIECKAEDKYRGEDIIEAWCQCTEYSLLTNKGKQIPIFLYPELSNRVIQNVKIPSHNQKEGHEHSTFNTLAANLGNFGEIRRRKYVEYYGREPILRSYYEFRFCNYLIYRCKQGPDYGLHKDNYDSLIYRIQRWHRQSPISKISSLIHHTTAMSTVPSPASVTEPSKTP